METVHNALSHRKSGAIPLLCSQPFPSDRETNDVDDGVGRAHLVKVDFLYVYPVDLRLCRSEALKNRNRTGLDRVRKSGTFNEFRDFSQTPVNGRFG